MKLSIRSKIANGLVLCLVVPQAAKSTNQIIDDYRDGLRSFTAQDNFDPAADNGSFPEAGADQYLSERDPSGGDPSGGDPSGGDPSGGDPTGCEPPGEESGRVVIEEPDIKLIWEEWPLEPDPIGPVSGTSNKMQVSVTPVPAEETFLSFSSTMPDQGNAEPRALVLGLDACIPQTVRVVAENDGVVDGDITFGIEVKGAGDNISPITYTVVDNDTFPAVKVSIAGPTSLKPGGKGRFTIKVGNVSRGGLSGNSLEVETSPGFRISGSAAALMSGDPLKSRFKSTKSGGLVMSRIALPLSDALLLTVVADLVNGDPDQSVWVRFSSSDGLANDTHLTVRTAVATTEP